MSKPIPADRDYRTMGSDEWQADVARRKACNHDWKVTARFARGLRNVTCLKCGHRRVLGA